MTDYIEQAIVTLSPEYHGELVPMRKLNEAIGACMNAGNRLDRIKKALFYGRDYPGYFTVPRDADCSQMKSKQTIDLMHGVIGCVTECAELLEALSKNKIDPINLIEEVGDIFWYCALIAHAMDFTFEQSMERNIAKLRTRYPDKFTEYDANNRNLEIEREILEKGSTDPDETSHLKS